jgi:hypothetical protein
MCAPRPQVHDDRMGSTRTGGMPVELTATTALIRRDEDLSAERRRFARRAGPS